MSDNPQHLSRIGDRVRMPTHTTLGDIEGEVHSIVFSTYGRAEANVAWDGWLTPAHRVDLADLEVVETVEDRLKRQGLAHILTPEDLDRLEYGTLFHDDAVALLTTLRAYAPLVEALARYENSASDEEGCPFCHEYLARYDPHLPTCPVVLARVARGISLEQAMSSRLPADA